MESWGVRPPSESAGLLPLVGSQCPAWGLPLSSSPPTGPALCSLLSALSWILSSLTRGGSGCCPLPLSSSATTRLGPRQGLWKGPQCPPQLPLPWLSPSRVSAFWPWRAPSSHTTASLTCTGCRSRPAGLQGVPSPCGDPTGDRFRGPHHSGRGCSQVENGGREHSLGDITGHTASPQHLGGAAECAPHPPPTGNDGSWRQRATAAEAAGGTPSLPDPSPGALSPPPPQASSLHWRRVRRAPLFMGSFCRRAKDVLSFKIVPFSFYFWLNKPNF